MGEGVVSAAVSLPIAAISSGKITGKTRRPASREIMAETAIESRVIAGRVLLEGGGGRRTEGLRVGLAEKLVVAIPSLVAIGVVPLLTVAVLEMPSTPTATTRASRPKRVICHVSTVPR